MYKAKNVINAYRTLLDFIRLSVVKNVTVTSSAWKITIYNAIDLLIKKKLLMAIEKKKKHSIMSVLCNKGWESNRRLHWYRENNNHVFLFKIFSIYQQPQGEKWSWENQNYFETHTSRRKVSYGSISANLFYFL